MPSIDFFTVICERAEKFATFLKETARSLASNRYEINYKSILTKNGLPHPEFGAMCRDTPMPEYEMWVPVKGRTPNKFPDTMNSSVSHGHALNQIKNYSEADYIVIADVDIALSYKNWDQVVVEHLEQADIFGGEYYLNSKRYRNFPGVFFFCCRREVIDKLDFLPSLNENFLMDFVEVNNEYLAEINSVPIGSMIYMDTGFLLPECANENKYTHIGLPHTNEMHERKLGWSVQDKTRPILWEPKVFGEWHYNNKVFASHYGGLRLAVKRGVPYLENEYFGLWARRVREYTKQEWNIIPE
jgi:hypothetical protein